jgi:hypothetical protein
MAERNVYDAISDLKATIHSNFERVDARFDLVFEKLENRLVEQKNCKVECYEKMHSLEKQYSDQYGSVKLMIKIVFLMLGGLVSSAFYYITKQPPN